MQLRLTWILTFGLRIAPLPTANPYQSDTHFNMPGGDARIRTLEHAVKSLEKRVTGEGTKVGCFLFQSKEDLCLWIAANVPTNRFGLFLNGVSIFVFWLSLIWTRKKTCPIFITHRKMDSRLLTSHISFNPCKTCFQIYSEKPQQLLQV
jgi:hypothetical protein